MNWIAGWIVPEMIQWLDSALRNAFAYVRALKIRSPGTLGQGPYPGVISSFRASARACTAICAKPVELPPHEPASAFTPSFKNRISFRSALSTYALMACLLVHCQPADARHLPEPSCRVDARSAFLVLDKFDYQNTFESMGNASLSGARLNAASTVKLALALALLQNGFDPLTRISVRDPHVPMAPGPINLSQALLYSSNDYFRRLAKSRGLDFFRSSVDEQAFYPESLPSDWPGEVDAIIHGGASKTMPLNQLLYMESLLAGEHKGGAQLLSLVRWPMTVADRKKWPGLEIYGKTGAWDRTVWFLGGARMGQRFRSIVIVRRGHWKTRREAIRIFYCRMGLELPNHALIPD